MKVLKTQKNSRNCIICGMENELGLKAPFYILDDDSVASVYFRNVNDGSVAGLVYKNAKAFSTAFCPYVLPGPMDTQYLYDKFEDMMEGK